MSSAPRLRFAPSPTGYLHIGGVRTALFNWLWARKTGGTFIVRIEDTDRERSTEENERVVLESLSWLGLTWDEGPGVGGPHGPYRQTERLEVYQEFVQKLLDRGAAYRCYATKEELDAQREAFKKDNPKGVWRYPGTWRDHPGPYPDRPFVVRLKAPTSGEVTYVDKVFGEVRTPADAIQDAVLMRADGVPLYNLGAVVDDITMGVTLVARGRDHMINTPQQILLYRALDAEVPEFAHLPMMLGRDGQKLSKRHGAVSVGEYRQQGIPAPALLNYLSRFGWSFGDEEVFSIKELIEKFSWENCSRSDGKFDEKKLAAISFEHLKTTRLTSDEEFVEKTLAFLEQRGVTGAEPAIVHKALDAVRQRADSFAEAAYLVDYLFRDPPELDEKAKKKFLTPDKAVHLGALKERLSGSSAWDAPTLQTQFEGFMADRPDIKMKDVAQPARVALTGRTASPGLYEVMEWLGRARTLERLERAVEIAGSEQ